MHVGCMLYAAFGFIATVTAVAVAVAQLHSCIELIETAQSALAKRGTKAQSLKRLKDWNWKTGNDDDDAAPVASTADVVELQFQNK